MKTNLIGISGKIGSGKDLLGKILQYLDYKENVMGGRTQYGLNDFPIADSNYEIKKFADKLKDMACLLIGCTREQLEDREFKEAELGEEWWLLESQDEDKAYIPYLSNIQLSNHPIWKIIKLTPRKLLQLLGTECGRQIIHPNIWVNALFTDYIGDNVFIATEKDEMSGTQELIYPNWIITDCRFPNEAKAIKDRGGIVIRVERNKQCGSCENIFIGNAECPACGSGNWVYGNIDSNHPSEIALDDYDFDHVIDNNGSIEELVEKVKQLNLV